ncbi:MAG TPA: hypothetical protein VMB27_01865 [Solirubrobacteraceae bacterium]|nr:hypothetical protein [Solirubrobacteraceae bacterium]
MVLALAMRAAVRDERRARAGKSALRCSTCGIDWPPDARHYDRCPACLQPTDRIGGRAVQPMDRTEARSIRLHHEFERFYAIWRKKDAA